MSKESAANFVLEVMEDNELRERTAKLPPEELLPIAKEMGYDFTEEELTAVMDESHELTADQLEAVAGGGKRSGRGKKNAWRCYQNPNNIHHDYEVIGHEERWMFWGWTRGYDIIKCKYCGHISERRV